MGGALGVRPDRFPQAFERAPRRRLPVIGVHLLLGLSPGAVRIPEGHPIGERRVAPSISPVANSSGTTVGPLRTPASR